MIKLFFKKPNIHGLGSFLSYLFVPQTQYVYLLFVIHDPDSFSNIIWSFLQHNMHTFFFHVWYIFNAVTHFFLSGFKYL